MWKYTKCTLDNREKKLKELQAAFRLDKDCSSFLSDKQQLINSTQTTIVLLQDIDENILIEMDYVPVNDYVFYVIDIDENGIKRQGILCKTIEAAIHQFSAFCEKAGGV